MPENNNYENENQNEMGTDTADDNRDLMLLAGGAALAGAGAYALFTKVLIPGAKKVGGWVGSKIPFGKKTTDVNEVRQAGEEPEPKKTK